ncbi:MAG: hydrolase [Acidiferrobacteraceae bacterium]|jgi:Xaa-Pro aminopeptidase|nr:hydrolase [Acidiferrobacteraceae bacterium]|tara:strand:+ start:198 stop:1514 length:1317 start_codon:yes stop_codon:yes gene_type:complete
MPTSSSYTSHDIPEGAKPTKEILDHRPRFSLAEKDRRWDGIRKKMKMANLDALVLLGNDTFFDMGLVNVRYLTHIGSKVGTNALFFLDEDPIVWNALPHQQRPTNIHHHTQDWTTDIRPFLGLNDMISELRSHGIENGRVGLIGFSSSIVTTPTLLHKDVVTLEEALPNLEFVPAGSMMEEMRLIKSQEELAMLGEASRISRLVVDTFINYPKVGMTEAELWAEFIKTMIVNGAEPQVFFFLASGPVEHDEKELWHLLHGEAQPAVPSMRPLSRGDVINAEWHVQYSGYLAATEFTVYLGDKAPEKLKDLHKISVECLEVSLEYMKPGNTLREAWEAIRAPAEKAGLDFVELGFHGHGMASPEFPTVIYRPGYGPPSLNGTGIGDLMFEEGMVFGNNIDLSNPKWKPDVGCMFGDMVVVRENCAERLVDIPLFLPEVG